MCGIVGYIGKQPASPIIVEGLRRLEYRGYDSAGRLIKFGTEPLRKKWWSFIADKRVVAEVEPDPAHVDELRLRLASILGLPEATSLDELEREALGRFLLS